jgi:hypothetical protein
VTARHAVDRGRRGRRRRQPQVHAQLVSALVDGGVDLRTAIAAPRWFVEPAEHFAPPVEVRLEPRHAPGSHPRWRPSATR